MPADQPLTSIGIIAGGGDIPAHVAQNCAAQGIQPFIIALKGHADPALTKDYDHIQIKLGQVEPMLAALKQRDITDLIMIGAVRRPAPWQIAPDKTARAFLKAHNIFKGGDNALLIALKDFLAQQGFTLHGAHLLAPDLLTPEGALTQIQPDEPQQRDIALGIEAALKLGAADIGQAVIVQNGAIIAEETAKGTDAMIKGVRKGMGATLIKLCKPQQDKNIDLPTVGLKTLKNMKKQGLAGVAIHAENSLIVDREACIAYANANGLFIQGVTPA